MPNLEAHLLVPPAPRSDPGPTANPNTPHGGPATLGPARGTRQSLALAVLLFLAPLTLVCCGDQEKPPSPPSPVAGYAIRPEATWTTGILKFDEQGRPLEWMLPSGQRLTPVAAPGARRLEIADTTLPLGLAVHPRGRHLFLTTAGGGDQALMVLDLDSGAVLHRLRGSYFLGLAFRPPDGDEVYVSAAGKNLLSTYAFNADTGELTPLPARNLPVPGFAGGICVSPDGSLLLALSQFTGFLRVFDLQTAREIGSIPTHDKPYAVALHPGGQEAYVSCEEASTLDVFDLSDPAHPLLTASLPTQKNPEAVLVNQEGSRLYVTNADEDSITVFAIGDGAPSALATIDLRRSPGLEYGSSPNALAFSPGQERLYAAQAGLNKLAVLDAATGTHLGDIPTGAYPTAVVLYGRATPEGGVEETLVVANGKGVGTPGEGEMGKVPGDLTVLPAPADAELPGLTELARANNAFPGRLFDLAAGGEWPYPIPRTRDRLDPTPIKHVFLVIRENKTYDYLLGAYQPAAGHANGDPAKVMDEHQRVLPNLYKLARRFAICDNYYSNAEDSDQGHELLTSSTINTYVSKLVFADDRPLPIQLEMVLSPAAWPLKDFIFQNALRNGITFRDYGEAVGAGKDLLLLNEQYVHQSPLDPPWFNLLSRDEEKILGRIQEWESERFSGPNFPQLIVMLLPNDHTFGDDAFMPSFKSMVADNDLATGLFVEWLSRSPYWTESVAFITEDDPQQGVDHVDPHRTMMLVVSPWVKPDYVSHVRFNEAHLYATMEYILGLPPLTLFDQAAQPMYDLFDFTLCPEAYEHEPKQVPWELNPPGTTGARRAAQMYFARPDMAEGLMEAQREMEAERREARTLPRRAGERAARIWRGIAREILSDSGQQAGVPGPVQILETMADMAAAGDREGFRGFLDSGVADLVRTYSRRRESLPATVAPEDPVEEFFRQFLSLRPRPVSVRIAGDQAEVEVVYRDGVRAGLGFRREAEGWKFDLSRDLGPTVRILGDTCLIKETFEASKALSGRVGAAE